MEGRPGALLHVRLLLPHPEPEGDPERREADGGAEGALRVQVLNLDKRCTDCFLSHTCSHSISTLCPAACKDVARSANRLCAHFCFCQIAKLR